MATATRRKRQHEFTTRAFGRKEIDRIVKMVERFNLHGIQLQSKFSLVFVTPVLGSRDKVGFLKKLAGKTATTGVDRQGQTYVDGGWRLTYMQSPGGAREPGGGMSSGGVGGQKTTDPGVMAPGGHNNFNTLRDALRAFAKRNLHGDDEVTVGLHEARALEEQALAAGDRDRVTYEFPSRNALNAFLRTMKTLRMSKGLVPSGLPGVDRGVVAMDRYVSDTRTVQSMLAGLGATVYAPLGEAITPNPSVAELPSLLKHHDGWWSQYVRASTGSGPPVSRAEEAQMYRQVEGYKERIAGVVLSLGHKVVTRKTQAMLKWMGRGDRRKAQGAYWAMRAELRKVGVLSESEPARGEVPPERSDDDLYVWHITSANRARRIKANGFEAAKTNKGRGLSFSMNWQAARGLMRTARRMFSFDSKDEVAAWFRRQGAKHTDVVSAMSSFDKLVVRGVKPNTPPACYLTLMTRLHPAIGGPARKIATNEFLWADIGKNLLNSGARSYDDIVAVECFINETNREEIPGADAKFDRHSIEAELYVDERHLWRIDIEDIFTDPTKIKPPLSQVQYRKHYPDSAAASARRQ